VAVEKVFAGHRHDPLSASPLGSVFLLLWDFVRRRAAAVLLFGLDLIPTFRAPCLLVVSGEKGVDEKALLSEIKAFSAKYKVRSRNMTKKGTEWILEVNVKEEAGLVERVGALDGVVSVNLLTHDGEVRF